MTRTTARRIIDAPLESVFAAVSDIRNLPRVVPDIVKIEVLGDTDSGVGTRFRETRLMKGRETVTELEVTEFVSNERVRMIADSHGTIWDSVFTVRRQPAGTELMLRMDANAQKFLPKLLNPVLKGLFKKGLDKHMDAVKHYCEHAGQPPPEPA